ncbi:MAG: NADH-quinone oxidoreductase subunit H [Candidatus Bathyarchaeota archaeon]|nr:NADH-quinone oxidoreductase subunit H [Candidatus Bathyarchaeota archaeon]MDH5787096.1 NADH-quinone oxidoreductase subunit H [Candidatus Bathyarchaeota archaeon]
MNTVIILLITFPLVFLLSLLFEGIDRKVHARMQKRIGPPIIQPFYDFVKLFNKERIIPMTASSRIFTTVPIIAAAASILGASIPVASLIAGSNVGGDLIIILYLLTISPIMVMIGGSSSGNPYGAVGFSRKMTMLIAYEVPMLICILSVSVNYTSLAYYDIVLTQVKIGSLLALARPSMAAAAAAFVLCMPAYTETVPFDMSEAKTEIVHGSLVEYGGPYLGLVKLAKSASNFALSFLAVSLFFYTPALLERYFSPELGGAMLLCLVTTLIFMVFTMTVPRTIFARLKIGQAFKFYWLVPLTLSIISVALSILGL